MRKLLIQLRYMMSRQEVMCTPHTGKQRTLHVAAAQKETGVEDVKKQVTEVADNAKGNLQQLLGIRGGSKTTDIWKIRLQLTKPVTWVPLIWGKRRLNQSKARRTTLLR